MPAMGNFVASCLASAKFVNLDHAPQLPDSQDQSMSTVCAESEGLDLSSPRQTLGCSCMVEHFSIKCNQSQ